MSVLPVAVLMSGAPGSGKSTLGRILGERLRMPVVEKDLLREACLWSLDSTEVGDAPWGPGLWYPILEAYLDLGISVVGDMTLFPGISNADVCDRLVSRARVVQVHCRSTHALDRFRARVAADPLRHQHADFAVEAIRPLAESLTEPLDLGCPTWVVDTTVGYQPSPDSLVAELVDHLGPHLRLLAAPRGEA